MTYELRKYIHTYIQILNDTKGTEEMQTIIFIILLYIYKSKENK